MATYLDWDAVNSSVLTHMQRTPSYCRWRLDHPQKDEETPATKLGTAMHCALLEPDVFDTRYILDPQSPKFLSAEIDVPYPAGWRNTKDYKAAKKELTERGFLVMAQDDLDKCRTVQEKVAKHKSASSLMRSIEHAEASVVAEDPDTGLILKVRPDALCGDVVCHIKTTRNAAPRAFDRDIELMGYHRALAFYADTLAIAYPGQYVHHVFLIVENTWPCDVAVRHLELAAMEKGRIDYRAALERFWACKEQDCWPGYSEKIEPCGIPKWAYYTEEED